MFVSQADTEAPVGSHGAGWEEPPFEEMGSFQGDVFLALLYAPRIPRGGESLDPIRIQGRRRSQPG